MGRVGTAKNGQLADRVSVAQITELFEKQTKCQTTRTVLPHLFPHQEYFTSAGTRFGQGQAGPLNPSIIDTGAHIKARKNPTFGTPGCEAFVLVNCPSP